MTVLDQHAQHDTLTTDVVEGVRTFAVPVAAREAAGLVVEDVLLVDVREPREWRRGRVPGSVNVPLDVLAPAHLPSDQPVLLVDGTGFRARRAAQLLSALGADDSLFFVLDGGVDAWEAAGLPVTAHARRGLLAR